MISPGIALCKYRPAWYNSANSIGTLLLARGLREAHPEEWCAFFFVPHTE